MLSWQKILGRCSLSSLSFFYKDNKILKNEFSKEIMKKILAALLTLQFAACTTVTQPPLSQANNPLTQGNVQLTLKKGVTKKLEVLEKFGAPNITTRDSSGMEVWTYQRNATVTANSSASNYWTVILLGGSSQASGFEQTNRTMTLIIKFDASDNVFDFRSRTSNF